ncbi:MAG: hypothetical protein AB9891_16960 [Anaerolineaceae bacterium]
MDWAGITAGIKKNGIRNAAQTTIAPTGTIATVAGCEGYGCEPVFALAYIRHVNDNGRDLQLTYASPLFDAALHRAGLDETVRDRILKQIMVEGTCQGVNELPAELRDYFVVSHDITAEEHVRMQAALQAFVDNSLSKTINFPASAEVEDVGTAYQLAWELGCKGITVYVTGSREQVVLETHATAGAKKSAETEAEEARQLKLWQESKKPRPRTLPGYTYSIDSPLGKAFITINENGEQPALRSLHQLLQGRFRNRRRLRGHRPPDLLRPAPVLPGRGHPAPAGSPQSARWASAAGGPWASAPTASAPCPTRVGHVLEEYLQQRAERPDVAEGRHIAAPAAEPTLPALHETAGQKIGDLCPECGQASVVNEEGCRKCYSCGFSEC